MQGLDLLDASPREIGIAPPARSLWTTQLKELVAIMAGHDQVHIRQVENTLPSI